MKCTDPDEPRPEYGAALIRGGARGKYAQRCRAGTNLVGRVPKVAATFLLSGTLRSALEQAPLGVVGLVDDLLRLCPEQGLRLAWEGDRCRVNPLAGGSEEVLDRPLRKSVFRAILARVAALCNERSPNSVSPYGGQGELSYGADPPATFRVKFTNTTDEQKLELVPVPKCVRDGRAKAEARLP
jgi:hypothetical protein